jgi:hypothetical protein
MSYLASRDVRVDLIGIEMAYELGLIGTSTQLDPLALLRELAAAVDPTPAVEEVRIGDSWASCEFVTTASASTTVQANISDELVANVAANAYSSGVNGGTSEFNLVISIVLVEDPNWDYVRMVARVAQEKWSGVLFDEVAGLSASLE